MPPLISCAASRWNPSSSVKAQVWAYSISPAASKAQAPYAQRRESTEPSVSPAVSQVVAPAMGASSGFKAEACIEGIIGFCGFFRQCCPNPPRHLSWGGIEDFQTSGPEGSADLFCRSAAFPWGHDESAGGDTRATTWAVNASSAFYRRV